MEKGIAKYRVEALTDGVFAFAMTLLVMNIEVPESLPVQMSENVVRGVLEGLAPDVIHYAVAFAVLAGFWMIHHSVFEHIRHLNRGMVWMNLAPLLFVALLPFSTQFAETHVDSPSSALVFEANIFAIGALYWAQWFYACKDSKHLVPGVSEAHLRKGMVGMAIMPGISLVAMGIALMGFTWSTMLYLLTPLLYMLLRRA